MSNNRLPTVTNMGGKRTFDCFPMAGLIFIVDQQERVLMLSHPRADGRWEVVNGALEHGESILDGCLREAHEEAGEEIKLRPLGIVHAYTHHYEPGLPMASICYLMAYEGGEVVPGDDMAGSEIRWVALDEIDGLDVIAPRQTWLFGRAVELFRVWRDEAIPPLEKGPDQQGGYKYAK